MVIVMVIDQYDTENEAAEKSKGAAIWASRYAEELRAKGHEVRIAATGDSAPGKYVMKSKFYPFVSKIADQNGFTFARMDEPVIRQAFAGADIVHFFMPFKLSYTSLKVAQEMNIPVFSAFHAQPENVTYNLGFKHFPIVATYIYGRFNRTFYKHFDHIHCPTEFIADQLKKHNYKSNLHVISNGVAEGFHSMEVERPPELKDKFIIGMVGRLAAEKRQDLIIRAVAMSPYKDKIHLDLCGQGPKEEMYKKLAKKLKVSATFGYYPKEELLQHVNMFDLYVHASEIEIEAIACLEALACGKVPVIADSPNSATKNFALDSRSLFHNKDPENLRRKIEYWMDNPDQIEQMSGKYVAAAQANTLSKSIEAIEKVYEQVIAEHNAKGKESVS
ncbi:MAG: glycosyltransferase [Clostridia bacterium]|jgi:1,2-diacylglycerol 3-alpha-glucosyltransferase|nr:glycosyltransferase [Clostridia bacterium]